MLISLLNGHPDIYAYGELFGVRNIRGLRGRYRDQALASSDFVPRLKERRDRDPVAFLYEVAFDSQGLSTVGFKLKHEQLVDPKLAVVRKAVRDDREIRVILLRRRNLLRRFVSHEIASRTRTTTVPTWSETPKPMQLKLTPQACIENFRRYEQWEDEVSSYWSHHPTIQVCYEELVDGNGEVLRIQEFLGVEPLDLRPRTRKILSTDLRSLISNYDELREALQSTEYSRFFS